MKSLAFLLACLIGCAYRPLDGRARARPIRISKRPTPISLSPGIPTKLFPEQKVPCETHSGLISTPPPTARLSLHLGLIPLAAAVDLAVNVRSRPESSLVNVDQCADHCLGILQAALTGQLYAGNSDLPQMRCELPFPSPAPEAINRPAAYGPCLWALPPEMFAGTEYSGANIKNLGYARPFFPRRFAVAGFPSHRLYG